MHGDGFHHPSWGAVDGAGWGWDNHFHPTLLPPPTLNGSSLLPLHKGELCPLDVNFLI